MVGSKVSTGGTAIYGLGNVAALIIRVGFRGLLLIIMVEHTPPKPTLIIKAPI